jgi:hypothetical protein
MADSAICSRCGCDLTLMHRARSQAGAAIDAALRAWAEGAPSSALAHARDALALDNTQFGRALRRALEQACRSAKGGADPLCDAFLDDRGAAVEGGTARQLTPVNPCDAASPPAPG